MKILRFIFYTILVFTLLSLWSCNRREGPQGADRELAIQEALPVGQYLMGQMHGKEMGRLSGIWVQHLAGVRGQYSRIERYDIDNGYLDASWEEMFLFTNYHFDLVIRYATEIDAFAYRGIARILQAFMFSVATDLYGDLPFEEAILYFNAGKPAYDSQEDIYSGINSLILDGISDLNLAINNNSIIPGPDVDYMYQGDLDKWIKAASLLRLRTTLKISHEDANYNHSLKLIDEGGFFDGNNDNLYFPYNIHADLPNPRYDFDFNIRNVRVSQKIVDLLIESDDPRLPLFVKRNSMQEYVGSAPGELNQGASFIGSAFASDNSPVYLLTYAEQKFIMAEVYHRIGQLSDALENYTEGLIASLDQFGIENPTWVNEQVQQVQDLTLEDIMTAKYIAMFLNPEAWADWRRTGLPMLEPPVDNVLNDQFPRRFPYPAMEYFYNAENVPDNVGLTDKVWWDVE